MGNKIRRGIDRSASWVTTRTTWTFGTSTILMWGEGGGILRNDKRDKNNDKESGEEKEEEEEGWWGAAAPENAKEEEAKNNENLSLHTKRIKRLNTQTKHIKKEMLSEKSW